MSNQKYVPCGIHEVSIEQGECTDVARNNLPLKATVICVLICVITFNLFSLSVAKSQGVSINNTGSVPNASAGLDVDFTNKGMLIPRVNIANLATFAPITGASVTSLLVYNTNVTTGVGYYYWEGTKWLKLTSKGEDWSLTGNSNIQASSFLGPTNNASLNFRTNNTERMRITSAGNVRIGTTATAPSYKLHVFGQTYSQNAAGTLYGYFAQTSFPEYAVFGKNSLNGSNITQGGLGAKFIGAYGFTSVAATQSNATYGGFFTGNETTGTDAVYGVYGNGWSGGTGNVYGVYGKANGFGTGVYGISPSGWAIWANGFAGNTSGTWSASDKRLKRNITPIKDALTKVMQIRGVEFEYRKDKFKDLNLPEKKQMGFIAQELERILPNAVMNMPFPVTDTTYDFKTVNYSEVIPVLLEAVKEQQKTIEKLNNRVKILEKKK